MSVGRDICQPYGVYPSFLVRLKRRQKITLEQKISNLIEENYKLKVENLELKIEIEQLKQEAIKNGNN